MKRFINALLGATLCSLLIACGGASTPEDAAKTFIEKMYQGKADDVVAMIHIPDDQKDQAGLKEMVSGKIKADVAKTKARAEANGGVDKIVAQPFKPFEKDEKYGKVKVETVFKNGKTETDSVKVIHTDDGWKIGL